MRTTFIIGIMFLLCQVVLAQSETTPEATPEPLPITSTPIWTETPSPTDQLTLTPTSAATETVPTSPSATETLTRIEPTTPETTASLIPTEALTTTASETATLMPTANATPTPTATATIVLSVVNGIVLRPAGDSNGIVVQLVDSGGSSWSTTTLQNGEFAFTDVLPGSYILQASASGHLSAAAAFTLLPGMTVTLPTIDLPQGDLNDDERIDEADVAILSALYGKSFAHADLDGSGLIGLADLRLLAEVIGQTGPVIWR